MQNTLKADDTNAIHPIAREEGDKGIDIHLVVWIALGV